MRKRNKKLWTHLLFGTVALATLSLGATFSFKARAEKLEPEPARVTSDDETSKDRLLKDVTLRLGGMQVAVDPTTGQLRPLTKAEARKLAREMRKMFRPRKVDEPTVRGDGSLSAVAAPNFLSFSVARVQEDGSVSLDCAESLDEAVGAMTGEPQPKLSPREEEK